MSKLSKSSSESGAALSRRGMLVGAGAVGAAAVAATAVSKAIAPAQPQPVATAAAPATDAGGYRLTAHIERYYQTARV